MPPENLAGFRERLATLEAQHDAMREKHIMSVASLSERLDAHIDETERQFASVHATASNAQVSIDSLASTVNKFISAHNAIDGNKVSTRDWVVALVGVAGTVTSILVAVAK